MISWLWLIPAVFAGVMSGLFIAGLCIMARGDHGCICEDEAVCSKQADGV